MTALTVVAPAREHPSGRPVPWRRMAWVTWRQHRFALAGVAVFLGAVAIWLWVAGLKLHHAYAAATACDPATPGCADLINRLTDMNHALVGGYILQPIAALIGAFVGAPVLARELETGTFRYAFTQGIGRWRWTVAKLVSLAVVVAAAAGAIGVLISWYYRPYLATGNQARGLSEASPFSSGLFDLRGPDLAAWTLAAFAIGALAGMLIRRIVPAIVAALAAYTGLALVAANLLRQHYLPPVNTSDPNVPGSAWILSQWWTKGGTFAFAGRPPEGLIDQFCSSSPVGPNHKPTHQTIYECLAQHGYTTWTSYQPASRFMAFQWIEGGWLLALSVLLIAATVWLVRRRAA